MKKTDPKERVKTAASIAERIADGIPSAQAAVLDVLNGQPAPLPELGEDQVEPEANLAASIWWACKSLEAIQGEKVEAPRSVLRELRDEGNASAGELFEIIGDLALPDLPKSLIGAAAAFAVIYWDTRSRAIDRSSYEFKMDALGPFHDRKDEIKDLFLRCIGVRRALDRREGARYAFTKEALFFRKIHDLGGIQ